MTCRALSVVLVFPLLLSACGGGSGDGLAPAAEPSRSPVPATKPAGDTIPLGHKPEGMVADPRTRLLAVGLTNPDLLALVDMDTRRVVKRIPLPEAPRHLALVGPGGPVLVPAEKAGELVTVDLPGGRLRRIKVDRQPHDAAAARGRVFVGNEGGDTLSVLRGGREVRRLRAPVQPGGVAVSSDGRLVAVVGVSERALELRDTRTLRSRGKIDVGVGPTHIAARGRRFFVVDTRGGGLLEVRTERGDLRIHRRTNLPGGPYGLTYDPPRKRFWVTLTKTNQVVQLTERRRLRVFPTVRQPNSVAVDPRSGRVFVASRADGTLQSFLPPRLADGRR